MFLISSLYTRSVKGFLSLFLTREHVCLLDICKPCLQTGMIRFICYFSNVSIGVGVGKKVCVKLSFTSCASCRAFGMSCGSIVVCNCFLPLCKWTFRFQTIVLISEKKITFMEFILQTCLGGGRRENERFRFGCVRETVDICHSTLVEVRLQPQVLVLTFYLGWDRVFLGYTRRTGPRLSGDVPVSTSHLSVRVLGLKTWALLSPAFIWALGI